MCDSRTQPVHNTQCSPEGWHYNEILGHVSEQGIPGWQKVFWGIIQVCSTRGVKSLAAHRRRSALLTQVLLTETARREPINMAPGEEMLVVRVCCGSWRAWCLSGRLEKCIWRYPVTHSWKQLFVRSLTFFLFLCLAHLGTLLNVKTRLWGSLSLSLKHFLSPDAWIIAFIFSLHCFQSLAAICRASASKEECFPSLSLLLLSSLILFSCMEVIVPRAVKRILSFTQMRYSCCSEYEMGACREGGNTTGGDSANLLYS